MEWKPPRKPPIGAVKQKYGLGRGPGVGGLEGGGVPIAQSGESATPGQEVVGSIPLRAHAHFRLDRCRYETELNVSPLCLCVVARKNVRSQAWDQSAR